MTVAGGLWSLAQIFSGSPTMSPTLRRGLSDEMGSWKIICICGRSRRSSSPPMSVSSDPSKLTVPPVGRLICMTALPVVDLPHPDSPTRPRVSPGRTSKLTSDTAWTLAPVRPMGNST